jgi:hypothetical protein
MRKLIKTRSEKYDQYIKFIQKYYTANGIKEKNNFEDYYFLNSFYFIILIL